MNTCPQCNYLLGPLDDSCPRCANQKKIGAVAPSPPMGGLNPAAPMPPTPAPTPPPAAMAPPRRAPVLSGDPPATPPQWAGRPVAEPVGTPPHGAPPPGYPDYTQDLTDPGAAVVWNLAFAPLYGLILSVVLASALGGTADDFWFVTLLLNVVLVAIDAALLKKVGHGDISKLAFLVPVYLFRRASTLRQSPGYAWAWIATFAICLAAPLFVGGATSTVSTSAVEDAIKEVCSAKDPPCTGVVATKRSEHEFDGIISFGDGSSVRVDITAGGDGRVVWGPAR